MWKTLQTVFAMSPEKRAAEEEASEEEEEEEQQQEEEQGQEETTLASEGGSSAAAKTTQTQSRKRQRTAVTMSGHTKHGFQMPEFFAEHAEKDTRELVKAVGEVRARRGLGVGDGLEGAKKNLTSAWP